MPFGSRFSNLFALSLDFTSSYFLLPTLSALCFIRVFASSDAACEFLRPRAQFLVFRVWFLWYQNWIILCSARTNIWNLFGRHKGFAPAQVSGVLEILKTYLLQIFLSSCHLHFFACFCCWWIRRAAEVGNLCEAACGVRGRTLVRESDVNSWGIQMLNDIHVLYL